MKPFREFYLSKWPDAAVYPAARGTMEPDPPVAARVMEACADYMDALREEYLRDVETLRATHNWKL